MRRSPVRSGSAPEPPGSHQAATAIPTTSPAARQGRRDRSRPRVGSARPCQGPRRTATGGPEVGGLKGRSAPRMPDGRLRPPRAPQRPGEPRWRPRRPRRLSGSGRGHRRPTGPLRRARRGMRMPGRGRPALLAAKDTQRDAAVVLVSAEEKRRGFGDRLRANVRSRGPGKQNSIGDRQGRGCEASKRSKGEWVSGRIYANVEHLKLARADLTAAMSGVDAGGVF
jgi:hypothetical protein